VGLRAAIEYLEALGMDAVEAHAREMVRTLEARLREVRGVTVYEPGARRVAALSFNLDGMHPHDLASFLDTRDVCVRAGHHCAQPLMRRLAVAGTVRASVQVYTTPADIDALARAVAEARALA
jgi:cysteine desulfurase/selenocysteine lyase